MDITLKVIDVTTQQPIEDAHARTDQQIYRERKYFTDENGLATIKCYKALRILTSARKEGYYGTLGHHEIGSWVDPYVESKVYEIALKPIRNPIAMYAKHRGPLSGYFKIPENDIEIGYDLEKGDWVKPFGNGVVGDLLLTHKGDRKWSGPKHYKENYRYKISIRFSNEKDSLIPFMSERLAGLLVGGRLASDYEAPEKGYQPFWVQELNGGKNVATQTNKDPNRNYYFRVRTILDEDGNIVSAHYGKIYGDFPNIIHYFNPTPNDRNVEFDPDRNLATVDVKYDPRNPKPYQEAKWAIKVERP